MTRYIDADALIGALHNHAFLEGDDRSICYNIIQKQPTIDAEPVRHGKWIGKSTGGWHFTCCSECGYVEWNETNNYCPKCGADMRPEND